MYLIIKLLIDLHSIQNQIWLRPISSNFFQNIYKHHLFIGRWVGEGFCFVLYVTKCTVRTKCNVNVNININVNTKLVHDGFPFSEIGSHRLP